MRKSVVSLCLAFALSPFGSAYAVNCGLAGLYPGSDGNPGVGGPPVCPGNSCGAQGGGDGVGTAGGWGRYCEAPTPPSPGYTGLPPSLPNSNVKVSLGYSFTLAPMYPVDTLSGAERTRYLVSHPSRPDGKYPNLSWRDSGRSTSKGATLASLYRQWVSPYMMWEVERQCQIDHGVVCVIIETIPFP